MVREAYFQVHFGPVVLPGMALHLACPLQGNGLQSVWPFSKRTSRADRGPDRNTQKGFQKCHRHRKLLTRLGYVADLRLKIRGYCLALLVARSCPTFMATNLGQNSGNSRKYRIFRTFPGRSSGAFVRNFELILMLFLRFSYLNYPEKVFRLL